MTPDWMTWNDGTVPKLAQSIFDDKRYDLMLVLADALEEAGYDQCEPEEFRKPRFCYWHRLSVVIFWRL